MTSQRVIFIHRFYEPYNRNDQVALDQFIAPDVIDHNPFPDQAPGREGVKQGIADLHRAFADFHFTVEEAVVEGDLIADRIIGHGVHRDEFLGIPATGKEVSFQAMDIYRVVDDKIVDLWHVEDFYGLMEQLRTL